MSNNNRAAYLTPEGLEKVQQELKHLTTTRRTEVAQMIAEAKAEGDISENAGYDEAKTAQGFLEGRIRELENVLKHAVIIETDNKANNKVALGNTVVIREVGTDYDETYTLVGKMEADPSNGMISNESPMGSSLLNGEVGDQVVVTTPGGEMSFEIVNIK